MSIQPSGFRPSFDESRIHGDMAFIRSQVAQKLINEDAQAKGIVEMHAHEAIGFSDDPEAFKQITSNAQAEVDQLFAGKEGEIETFLKTQLPASEVKPVLEQLREEWHNEHNVHQNALGLVAEKERKAMPNPEDVFRATAQPKATPPSAGPTPGAGAPGAGGALPPWINDLIKKLFERYKEQSVVDQLVGAFTKGSPPSPELINLLNAWNSAPLLGKSGLYEQIKLALSGGAEEKKVVEKAAPKKEEVAPTEEKPKHRLFGAAGGEGVTAVSGSGLGAGPGPAIEEYSFLDTIQRILSIRYYPGAVLDSFNAGVPNWKKLSPIEQFDAVKNWAKDVCNNAAFKQELINFGQFERFQAIFFNPLNSSDPMISTFSKVLIDVVNWGMNNPWKSADAPQMKFFSKIFYSLYDGAEACWPEVEYIGPNFCCIPGIVDLLTDPLLYAKYPGISHEQFVALFNIIPGLKLVPPPYTELDRSIWLCYDWVVRSPAGSKERELATKLIEEAKVIRFTPDGGSKDAIYKLRDWAAKWIDTAEGKAIFNDKSITNEMRAKFYILAGFSDALRNIWISIWNWKNSTTEGTPSNKLATMFYEELVVLVITDKGPKELADWFANTFSTKDIYWQLELRDQNDINDIKKHLEMLGIPGISLGDKTAMDNVYLDVIDQLKKLSGNDRVFWQSFLDLFKQLNSRSPIADLNNLAKKLIGSEAYKKASFDTIWLFLDKAGFPAGELKELYQKASNWLKKPDLDSKAREIAEKLLQGIMSLVPDKGFADLQKWAVQFIKSDVNNFFAMKPGDRDIFFDITGTILEGVRFNLREWAKNDGEAKLLTEIYKLIDNLENGSQPAPDLNKLVGSINAFIIEHPAIYFDCFGLTDDSITRLAEFLKVKIDLPKTNDMDKILLTAWKFNPGADGSFWDTFKNQIKAVGHGGDRTQLQNWARDYIFKNFGAFSQFSPATQIQFMTLTGTLLEPTRTKLLLWLKSFAPNEIDPSRVFINAIIAQIDSLEKNKFNCTTEDLLNALKIDVLGPGKDLYYIYAGMTDVQLQQIGNILGINLALPSDMDRVIFESYRYVSNSESGKRLFSELIKFLKEHPESQSWSFNRPGGREEFNANLTLLFFLNKPAEFWRNYSSFSAQDIAKFKEITGLDIPTIPPDPFPTILDEIRNYIGDLQRLMNVLNAYASLYHTKPPQSWNDKDWKEALTVIGTPKNSGKFFTSKADRDKVLGMLHSRQNYSQIASALQLFTSAREEITRLQSIHGTAEDLRKWAERQDMSRLSPQDQAEFNKLKQFKG